MFCRKFSGGIKQSCLSGDKFAPFSKILSSVIMFQIQNKNTFSFNRFFLLTVIVANVLIIITAYAHNRDFYWILLWSIPMLFFAFYYDGIVYKNAIDDRKPGTKNFKFNEKDNPIFFRNIIKPNELTVLFGNSQCAQQYHSSIICFESVSADQNIKFMPEQIILSEENDYTQELMKRLNDNLFMSDSIWRIEPGYAGCRDHNFKFSPEAFRVNAVRPGVKMIELKLPGFNDSTNNPSRKNAGSDVTHTAFRNADSMVIFLDSLRQLSGKKPVGISLSITEKKEFHEMCYAFCKTHIIPDFIVVEGYEKENILLNNGSANPGMPLFEALLFISKTLEQYGLSNEIKIIAASEIYTALDVLKLRALGADAISMRNGFIRSYKPYQKDSARSISFVQQSMERLRSEILNSTIDVMQAWGYINIKDITLSSFFRSLDALQSNDGNREFDREAWNVIERKSYRLLQKGIYEKSTSSEVFLN